MNYSLYNIYINNTIALARSLVIKLNSEATAMNRKYIDSGIPIPTKKTDWRYYLHLAGEYSTLDTPMKIVSLDTMEEIVFNKENLKRHKKTRSVYLYGREYVDRLKARYGEQGMLIRGILNPVDINVAVAASDGSILGYTPALIEPQEHSLVSELESKIKYFIAGYVMESLMEVDDLYVTTMSSIIYSFLVPNLLDIRTKYIKTQQTHSFHITAYLASNQHLDEFMPYLTLSQQMFLYRNILYIERNTGMQGTLDLLIARLLTSRNLPIYDYTIRQQDMNVEEGELVPIPVFAKNQLNLKTGLTSRDLNVFDFRSVLYKEIPLATHNLEKFDELTEEAEFLSSYSSVSNLPTKILEVSAIDPENVAPIKYIDVLINEWIHMAGNGTYTAQLEILNPLNGDTVRLDPKSMFLVYIYAHMAGFHGIEMKGIAPFVAIAPLHKEWVPDEELLAMVPYDQLLGWDTELEFFAKTAIISEENILTVDEFVLEAKRIEKSKRVRHSFAYQPTRHTDRIARRTMYNHFYRDVTVDLRPAGIDTYQMLFKSLAIDVDDMSIDGWKDMAMQALDSATLFSTTAKISISDIQGAMVRLLRRLSSYTIQFIEEIVGGEVNFVPPLTAIPGNTFEDVYGNAVVNTPPIGIRNSPCSTRTRVSVDSARCRIFGVRDNIDRSFSNNLLVTAKAGGATRVSVSVNIPVATITDYTAT